MVALGLMCTGAGKFDTGLRQYGQCLVFGLRVNLGLDPLLVSAAAVRRFSGKLFDDPPPPPSMRVVRNDAKCAARGLGEEGWETAEPKAKSSYE